MYRLQKLHTRQSDTCQSSPGCVTGEVSLPYMTVGRMLNFEEFRVVVV
jgi:hypothetical protein